MMQVDLARLLDVGKVTVGGLVDRLEATGYVERRADPRDRRARRVCITDAGFAVLRKMIGVAGALNERILSRITPENQRITEETLAVVKETMKEILVEVSRSDSDGDRETFARDQLHS
jgi:DNA-binding MarR family transcriptional regulator